VREDLLDHPLVQDRDDDLQLTLKLPAIADGNWPGRAIERSRLIAGNPPFVGGP